jgi:hypothetical protein
MRDGDARRMDRDRHMKHVTRWPKGLPTITGPRYYGKLALLLATVSFLHNCTSIPFEPNRCSATA